MVSKTIPTAAASSILPHLSSQSQREIQKRNPAVGVTEDRMPSPIQNPRLLLTHCRFFPPKPQALSPNFPHFHVSSFSSQQQQQQLASELQTLNPCSPPSSQILTLRESLLSRERTAVEIAEEYLTRLRQTEPHIRSFLHVAEEAALREAEVVDRKIERGEELGPLAGVLVGAKDNLCTVDMPSTGGSRILDGYRPAYDATAVRRLREKGGIVVGKTNLDEFGMGSTTEASGFQVTANPWDTDRVPGGSSGGSAAAVSARQCMVSLGSDTGGSVRQPASFCGVVGMKPTYGRISRFGLMAYASSLDTIGCFSSSVMDTAILLGALSGHDKFDATSSQREVPDYASQLNSAEPLTSKPLKGLKVGVIRETLGDGVEGSIISLIQAAASHFEELGSVVTEVAIPSFSLGLPAYYILASSESSSNLSRYDGVRYGNQIATDDLSSLYGDSRANGFGPEVKMRILMGTYALSAGYYDAYYKRAQQVRTLVQKGFMAALDENDILISPAAPSAAYRIGEKTNNPLAMYAGDIMTHQAISLFFSGGGGEDIIILLKDNLYIKPDEMDTFTANMVWIVGDNWEAVASLSLVHFFKTIAGLVNVNLAGLPALVLPCGFVQGGTAGLPVGLQMIGAAFTEAKLLRVGHIFEQTLQGYSHCHFASGRFGKGLKIRSCLESRGWPDELTNGGDENSLDLQSFNLLPGYLHQLGILHRWPRARAGTIEEAFRCASKLFSGARRLDIDAAQRPILNTLARNEGRREGEGEGEGEIE
ncbi:hypothetical protein ACLOJK_029044 [Asimina triloba]